MEEKQKEQSALSSAPGAGRRPPGFFPSSVQPRCGESDGVSCQFWARHQGKIVPAMPPAGLLSPLSSGKLSCGREPDGLRARGDGTRRSRRLPPKAFAQPLGTEATGSAVGPGSGKGILNPKHTSLG